MAGRAAAVVGEDTEAASRLDRALHGVSTGLGTRGTGRRRVAVLARPEVEADLAAAGYEVEPLLPGTARAVLARSEVAVLDLGGFTGVWSGALDAEGVGLALEVLTAVEEGGRRGVTTWLLAGREGRSRLGAVALLAHPDVRSVDTLVPESEPHVTEDPGDAPLGIVDVLRARLAADDAEGARA